MRPQGDPPDSAIILGTYRLEASASFCIPILGSRHSVNVTAWLQVPVEADRLTGDQRRGVHSNVNRAALPIPSDRTSGSLTLPCTPQSS